MIAVGAALYFSWDRIGAAVKDASIIPTTASDENKSGVSSTMTILSWAFLGPVGLFVHNWVKGHEMELDGTHPLQVFVDDTVHVVSNKRTDANAGFAH